jgi:hypothetical protein
MMKRKRKPVIYEEEKPRRPMGAVIWSLLSVALLLGVACVAFVFVIIFTNPYTSLNPFPPPTATIAVEMITPTSTGALYTLPPTWTATIVPTGTTAPTATPTSTLPPTPTPVTLTPTPLPSETLAPTPQGGFAYELRPNFPKAIENINHPDLGCDWMGIGGQVIDQKGNPITGLIVNIGGKLPGVQIKVDTFTLTGVALSYGRAGYEIKLSDKPIASKGSLWVQLVDQAQTPISDKIFFDTFDSCDKNLIILDFLKVR